jgi:hypothetical protein
VLVSRTRERRPSRSRAGGRTELVRGRSERRPRCRCGVHWTEGDRVTAAGCCASTAAVTSASGLFGPHRHHPDERCHDPVRRRFALLVTRASSGGSRRGRIYAASRDPLVGNVDVVVAEPIYAHRDHSTLRTANQMTGVRSRPPAPRGYAPPGVTGRSMGWDSETLSEISRPPAGPRRRRSRRPE